jgi:HicB_like antitoxin of bacterial toxin-antitoxin system
VFSGKCIAATATLEDATKRIGASRRLRSARRISSTVPGSQYAIVIEGDGSTNYSAYAPDLPGVVATGDTLQECEAEMREAIEFHIEEH